MNASLLISQHITMMVYESKNDALGNTGWIISMFFLAAQQRGKMAGNHLKALKTVN